MKKVLSVLLAAAMVMGMSVSAMATTAGNVVIGEATTGGVATVTVDKVAFAADFYYVDRPGEAGLKTINAKTNKVYDTTKSADTTTTFTFEPGDIAYFTLVNDNKTGYTGAIDASWYVNVKANGYVDSVSFVTNTWLQNSILATPLTTVTNDLTSTGDQKFVKVVIVDEFDDVDSATAKFYIYIADKDNSLQSKTLSGKWSFGNAVEKYVDFYFINDADRAAKWIVKEDDKGTAVFNIGDDDAYFTVKMISEEEVVLNLSTKYDIDIDAEYNEYDADLDFYNFKGTADEFTKKGELVIPADEDTFIYEIVDDEIVAVEAEYVEDYKVGNYKKVDGWMIETSELGYYVVADEELVVAEEEVEVEAPVVEDNKANPETGANDFVGAAVALAVVSVAAAGALALKK